MSAKVDLAAALDRELLVVWEQFFCCPKLRRGEPDLAAQLHLQRFLRSAAFGQCWFWLFLNYQVRRISERWHCHMCLLASVNRKARDIAPHRTDVLTSTCGSEPN
jgi:hypothetical protein